MGRGRVDLARNNGGIDRGVERHPGDSPGEEVEVVGEIQLGPVELA